MTRRQRLIATVAKRERQHLSCRDLEIKLRNLTTAKLRRELREGR